MIWLEKWSFKNPDDPDVMQRERVREKQSRLARWQHIQMLKTVAKQKPYVARRPRHDKDT